MNTQRNSFLEDLKFNSSDVFELYSSYLHHDLESDFYNQCLEDHKALMHLFPEVDFYTICRIKSFDSTLNKARIKGLENVYDIHGIRHIIRAVNGNESENLRSLYCYKFKDFLESLYENQEFMVPMNREKDYIAFPKRKWLQSTPYFSNCAK